MPKDKTFDQRWDEAMKGESSPSPETDFDKRWNDAMGGEAKPPAEPVTAPKAVEDTPAEAPAPSGTTADDAP